MKDIVDLLIVCNTTPCMHSSTWKQSSSGIWSIQVELKALFILLCASLTPCLVYTRSDLHSLYKYYSYTRATLDVVLKLFESICICLSGYSKPVLRIYLEIPFVYPFCEFHITRSKVICNTFTTVNF